MTTIVTSKEESNVVITSDSTGVIIASQPNGVVVTSSTLVPAGTLNNININLSNLDNGSLLVYNTATSEWVAQTLLNNQIIDSGQF